MAVSDMYAVVNGKTLNVYSERQLFDNFQDLAEDEQAAVTITNENGEKVVLPIRVGYKSMEKPGVYPMTDKDGHNYAFLCHPTTEAEKKEYIPDKEHLVDFKDAEGIQQLMSMTDTLNKSINQYLETDINSGNIYRAKIGEFDSPEMRGLKQALSAKNMEIDKYGEKFGANWANDKRKLNDNNITMFLLKRMGNNFDIDIDIVFRDHSPDVPNPMGKTITVNLVPGIKDEVIETKED
jgi:hypothetical protein